ncbi:DUF3995 domain-containing protein [Streptomyces sp. A7024]|uniref:DUF3995 domain-containing protein n=1 Tax=Streptomyces coryli TaxID=1128680 RepID=A0A6G4U0T2_9ACTN|nr:DUF3995 domain-containing protein [Streptomyces coryli]NGN65602.1 DUF3995 domain-containing protein [Streptomyces coryli]
MIRTLVPGLLTLILVVIGIFHFIWAATPWPWRDKVTFTKTIAGIDTGEMPPPLVTVLIGAALVGGGVLTLMVNGTLPKIGPDWLQLTGMAVLAAVMLVRGIGGYFMNAGAAAEFRHWNSVLYSPLCLVLCLLSTTVAVAAIRR